MDSAITDLFHGRQPCHVERTIELFFGTLEVANHYHLRKEPVRFNELQRQIPFISQGMLTTTCGGSKRMVSSCGSIIKKATARGVLISPAAHSLGDVVPKRLINEREKIRAASD